MTARATAASLVGVIALAFVARALGLHLVFLDDGRVVFEVGDALYHVHRARFSLANFPAFLAFDPCLSHPNGSSVPYPPGPDLLVAGLARLFGGGGAAFERIAAWMPVVLGSLAVVPVFALGRRLHSAAVGLGAGALLALAPIAIVYARVGYADHHAAVALFGAWAVAGYAAALDTRLGPSARRNAFIGLTIARVGLLLSWQGALLYLAPGELALVAAAVLRDRRSLMTAHLVGAFAVVGLVAPFVALSATPVAGPFSASELSWLHVVAFVCEIVILGGALLFEHLRESSGGPERGMRALRVALVVGAAVLAVPGVIDGLAPAFDFLAQRDQVGGVIPEQAPLLSLGGESSLGVGFARMGFFLLLVPLAPLALLARGRRPELTDASRYLFVWSLLAGVLAMQQVRYANDFAPIASVAFALVLAEAAGWLREKRAWPARRAAVAAVLVGLLLQSPTSCETFGGRLGPAWSYATGALGDEDRALQSVAGTQLRFADQIRATTPDTPGCDGTADVPDYAVLVPFTLGHAMHYVGRRATPADNFGPYVGVENFESVRAFFTAADERAALATVRRLGVSYVVTEEEGERFLSPTGRRLHREDGSASEDDAHWGRFRLLTEGPAGGLPSAVTYGGAYRATPPFKLFEVVEGAVLEVATEPGRGVEANIAIKTPSRQFVYRARDVAGEDGFVRLRVPYPTHPARGATRAVSRYQVRANGKKLLVDVTEADVRDGRVIRVTP